MNELHISLAIAGVLIVIGVYAFNRYQERKFRRQSEHDFEGGDEDILLEPADEEMPHDVRREPSMEASAQAFDGVGEDTIPFEPPQAASSYSSPERVEKALPVAEAEPLSTQALDEVVDYVAAVYPKESAASTVLFELESKFEGFSRPLRLFGQNGRTGILESVKAGSHTYDKLLIALQLVNRSGALAAAELDDFCARAQALADALTSMVDLPDRADALARAATLDEFCASVDVLIGMNVVTAGGETIPATKIRALAEASGMKLKADNAFHFMNDAGITLFSLSNFESPAFTADNIRHLSTHGVTLLLDVPRVANGTRVFDQMLVLARQISGSLGGTLVDDNQRPLSDAGIAKIKQQLSTIYTKMDAAGIPAGFDRALRLFS